MIYSGSIFMLNLLLLKNLRSKIWEPASIFSNYLTYCCSIFRFAWRLACSQITWSSIWTLPRIWCGLLSTDTYPHTYVFRCPCTRACWAISAYYLLLLWWSCFLCVYLYYDAKQCTITILRIVALVGVLFVLVLAVLVLLHICLSAYHSPRY